MTTKFFDSIIISRFGKTKEAKNNFIVQKKKKKWNVDFYNIVISKLNEMKNISKCFIGYLDESVVKLMISIKNCFFVCDANLVIKIFWIVATIKNAKNVRQYKSRFYLLVKKILAFIWSTNLVGGVKNLSPSFKWVAVCKENTSFYLEH